MRRPEGLIPPSLKELRNIFKGNCDVEVQYQSNKHMVKIYKTKLKE